MRRAGAWTIGAAAAVAIGLILLLTSSTSNSSQDEGITLPPLTYQSFESPTLMSGNVSGTVHVPAGDEVTVMVFDGTEYSKYRETGYATPLLEKVSNDTEFDASLGHTGKLYVVFYNEGTSPVYLQVHFDVVGLSMTAFLAVIGLFVIGGVLGFFAFRSHRKETKGPPPETPRE